MHCIHIETDRASVVEPLPGAAPLNGFLWLDCLHEEMINDPEELRAVVERLTGSSLLDLHLQDAANLQHPSYFDTTQDYDMVVFRKLTPGEEAPLVELKSSPKGTSANLRRTLQEIVTYPVTFFVFDHLLVTVRNAHSKTIEQMLQRLLDFKPRTSGGANLSDKLRLPDRPDELMLRLLNAMVDRYLELRQPLTSQLDRWQRELLDPNRPFNNWAALLDARIEIRKLENLCEEQYDALQELRDNALQLGAEQHPSDGYLVRINDVMEHINRVLNHARRLENSIETAVQLHFSAVSHRTNQIVQTLTVITAIFAPLTLITGIFGMNFSVIPGLQHPAAFWITLGAMAFIAVSLLTLFRVKRYLKQGR